MFTPSLLVEVAPQSPNFPVSKILMNNKIKKVTIFLGLIVAFLMRASYVLALEVQYPSVFGISLTADATPTQFFCYFFALITYLALTVAVLSIAFGGVYYLVSYGTGKFKNEAKAWIKAGITGLLIVVCATLLANTINPALSACQLAFLPELFSPKTSSVTDPIPDVPVQTYKEVPLGVLTETLLTKKTSCYGFDQEGNPIDGEKIKPDDGDEVVGPTYMDHDRADCLLQLIDGAQKKAQVISKLSDKINVDMNKCDCEKIGQCAGACTQGCSTTGKCPGGACKPSDCIGGACKKQPNNQPPDCCPAVAYEDDGTTPIKNDHGKTISVKQRIENGKYTIAWSDDCRLPAKTYHGLDEFRSDYDNSYDDIKKAVEKTPVIKVDKKEIYRIDYGECGKCNYTCQTCDPTKLSGNALTACQKKFDDCEAAFKKCQTNLVNCQNNSPWGKLKLIDQLIYFNGKIDEMKKKIQEDITMVKKAKGLIESRQCYITTSYMDLVKRYETADKEKVTLAIKDDSFKDPETKEPINASKYCSGFNYANSSCFKKCNDMCPDNTDELKQKYLECEKKKCDPTDKEYADCLAKQQECVSSAYNTRRCIYDGLDEPQKFESCISSCQGSCSIFCDERYAKCSSENAVCKNQCKTNSSCILDKKNIGNCLLGNGAQGFIDCAKQNLDSETTKYCFANASLCKNGSNQYAGYEDCSTSIPGDIFDFLTNDCSPYDHSASYFYEHPECQKCPNPDLAPESDSLCYNSAVKDAYSCQELCPEVSKCPASSNCPSCACDQISSPSDKTQPLPIAFSVPNESTGTNAGSEGETPLVNRILANQIVGPECNQYLYNDDPLTFYCEDEWWSDPDIQKATNLKNPLGSAMTCPIEREVPVGQTVDGALSWANWLMNIATKGKNETKSIIDNMNNAGKARNDDKIIKNYCKCDAKYENNSPICKTNCEYKQEQVETDTGKKWVCSCGFVPCKGNPCDQMIKYLVEIWNNAVKLKTDYIGFYTLMLQEQGRSDVMKQLTYSRKQVDACGVLQTNYGPTAKLFDCSWVTDQQIPPIWGGQITVGDETYNNSCYGKKVGDLSKKSLTDNWFCCLQQK